MKLRAECSVVPAGPEDVPAIAALLRAAELPDADFAPHVGYFLVARDEQGVIIGAVGAQICGSDALLRSLVVAPAWRGSGVGRELVRRLEMAAGAWGVERWWLLTTTAEKFFTARGFHPIPRSAAPAAIAATEEFRALCPSVAVCLSRERRSP
jgi:N-acetylglutamate synthase-like GNAT family acetyltransferase